MKYSLLFLLVLLGCSGAKKDTQTDSQNSEPMENETASGLKYQILTSADGDKAMPGKKIDTHCILSLEDGKEIWSTRAPGGQVFSFVFGQTSLIAGFDEAIAMMGKGDRYKVIIPPHLGYGERGSPPDIPGNATLIFDIEIVDITDP